MTNDPVVAEICHRLCVDRTAFYAAVEKAAAVLLGERSAVDRKSVVATALQVGVAAGTAGVWRISGLTTDGRSFSMVLKGLWNELGRHSGLWGTTAGVPSEPFHWRREASVYESGCLSRPGHGGVRSPDCLALIEADDDGDRRRIGVFMEEAQGQPGTEATLEAMASVARRLGRLQAALAVQAQGSELLAVDWLADRYPRAYVGRVEALVEETAAFEEWSLPLLRPFVARTFGGRSLYEANDDLWRDRYRFLSLIEDAPVKTLCHNDLWPAQIITNDTETVMFDLASVGVGPLGHDLGKLATEVMVRHTPSLEECRNIDLQLLAAYLAGAEEEGLAVNNPAVEKSLTLGFTAGLAATESYRLRGDWVQLALGNPRADAVRSQWGGRSPEQVFEFYANRTVRLLEHAETAKRLGDELGPVLGRPLPTSELLA